MDHDPSIPIASLRGPLLVLGAGGFVGANLFHRLRKVRSDVYGVVRRTPAWRLTDVVTDRVLEVDLTDAAAARNLVDSIAPQTVFDCVSYGGYAFEDREALIYQTNFTALVALVEQLARKPFAAFVHAGSSSEYGLNCRAPRESGPLEPNSHYAVSKVAMAHYLQYMGSLRNLPCVNLRLYAAYGPLEDTARLMPALVRAALAGGYPPFVNPDITRDFVYIDDVCDAFILAASRMNPALYGRSFNIATGTRTSIRALAKLSKSAFGLKKDPAFGSMPNRKWDLVDWYGDPALARRELGWKARTPLRDGLLKLRDWVATLGETDFAQRTKSRRSTRKRSVSAIVACYRDEQAIPVMHERLTAAFKAIGCDYELIFVNDGSPDACAEVIRGISEKDPAVLGISHSRNFGSQMAFRSGMELSTKDAVVLLDGDLQDPPELIPAFYQQWEQGFDVIYGRRVKREMPLFWGILFKAFYRVFAAFSYVKMPLDAGDFSLIDRKVVGWLLASPERDLFMRGLRAYVGFRQTGVDYVRPERLFGRSTNNLLKNIGWAKKAIFNYSHTPLNLLSAIGFALFGLTALAGLAQIALRIFWPELSPRGATTTILVTLFFGSINLLGIGILGEYIGKIMDEVKRRPRLIRSALIRGGQVSELLPDGSIRR